LILGAFVTFLSRPAISAEPTKSQCLTSNENAQSLRASGKLREARTQLLTCVAKVCPRPVRNDCAEWLAEIDKAMPTIVFEVKDGSGNDLTSVAVAIDGDPLVPKLDGTAITVDPGQHVFRFSSNGLPTFDKSLLIREGEKERREKIVLGEVSKPSTPEPGSASQTSDSSGDTQRTVGLVLGGAGVVGLVVGSVFGLMSKATYNEASQGCRDGGTCTTSDAQHGQDAHSQATTSTVVFVVGGALIAGGAVLYFTAPKAGSIGVAPAVGTNGVGLSMTGVW
jgi:hypothetical protein